MKTPQGIFFKNITPIHACKDYSGYLDCDFLAAAVAMYPECIDYFEKFPLIVECKGSHTRGLTILIRKSPPEDAKEIDLITVFNINYLTCLRKKMLGITNTI